MSIRVLVCGGRDFADHDALNEALDKLHASRTISTIIHGAARGADMLAANWAYGYVETMAFPAYWKKNGPAAGPIRNKQMLDVGCPDLVVAFAGGSGTANMVKQASARGVEVLDLR